MIFLSVTGRWYYRKSSLSMKQVVQSSLVSSIVRTYRYLALAMVAYGTGGVWLPAGVALFFHGAAPREVAFIRQVEQSLTGAC